MIGPGWLPRYRPRGLAPLGRRSRARSRKRSQRTKVERTGPSTYDLQLAGAEFPLATIRPREARGQLVALVAALQRWLVARWQWLRPRSVPCAVAGLGMLAVLAFSDYLAHYNDGECMKRATPSHIELAPR